MSTNAVLWIVLIYLFVGFVSAVWMVRDGYASYTHTLGLLLVGTLCGPATFMLCFVFWVLEKRPNPCLWQYYVSNTLHRWNQKVYHALTRGR